MILKNQMKSPLEEEHGEAVEDDEEEEEPSQIQERVVLQGKDVKELAEVSSELLDSIGDIHEGNEEENDVFLLQRLKEMCLCHGRDHEECDEL